MKTQYIVEAGFANIATGTVDNPSYWYFDTLEEARKKFAEQKANARHWWRTEYMCGVRKNPGDYVVTLSNITLDEYGEVEEYGDMLERYEYSMWNYTIEESCETKDYSLISSVYECAGLNAPNFDDERSIESVYNDCCLGFLGGVDGKALHYNDGSFEGAVWLADGKPLTAEDIAELF